MNLRTQSNLALITALITALIFVVLLTALALQEFTTGSISGELGFTFAGFFGLVWVITLFKHAQSYRKLKQKLFSTPLKGKILYKSKRSTGKGPLSNRWAYNKVKTIVTEEEIWVSLTGVHALLAPGYNLMHRFDRNNIIWVDYKKRRFRTEITITYESFFGISIQLIPWSAPKLLAALPQQSELKTDLVFPKSTKKLSFNDVECCVLLDDLDHTANHRPYFAKDRFSVYNYSDKNTDENSIPQQIDDEGPQFRIEVSFEEILRLLRINGSSHMRVEERQKTIGEISMISGYRAYQEDSYTRRIEELAINCINDHDQIELSISGTTDGLRNQHPRFTVKSTGPVKFCIKLRIQKRFMRNFFGKFSEKNNAFQGWKKFEMDVNCPS